MEAICENINVHVIGFWWEDFHHPLSKGGSEYTPEQLVEHLKMIVKSKRLPPSELPVKIPICKEFGQLGELAADAKTLDNNWAKVREEFMEGVEKLQDKNEAQGLGDCYSEFQPFIAPAIGDLLGKFIEVYCQYDIPQPDGSIKQECYWNCGLITMISYGKNIRKIWAFYKKRNQ